MINIEKNNSNNIVVGEVEAMMNSGWLSGRLTFTLKMLLSISILVIVFVPYNAVSQRVMLII